MPSKESWGKVNKARRKVALWRAAKLATASNTFWMLQKRPCLRLKELFSQRPWHFCRSSFWRAALQNSSQLLSDCRSGHSSQIPNLRDSVLSMYKVYHTLECRKALLLFHSRVRFSGSCATNILSKLMTAFWSLHGQGHTCHVKLLSNLDLAPSVKTSCLAILFSSLQIQYRRPCLSLKKWVCWVMLLSSWMSSSCWWWLESLTVASPASLMLCWATDICLRGFFPQQMRSASWNSGDTRYLGVFRSSSLLIPLQKLYSLFTLRFRLSLSWVGDFRIYARFPHRNVLA